MFSSDQSLVSNQIPISLDFPSEPDELNLFVQMIIKRIANATNSKESGLYIPLETATFISYFTTGNTQKFRNVYRKVIDFGSLPNATSKQVPHGIAFNSDFSTTRIYGSATDPVNLVYVPLPFTDLTPANSISLFLDETNINVSTGINRSNFTRSTVVIEYTKNL